MKTLIATLIVAASLFSVSAKADTLELLHQRSFVGGGHRGSQYDGFGNVWVHVKPACRHAFEVADVSQNASDRAKFDACNR